ncbi:MAG: peroxiredoxin family protein, partial [Caldisericaceae bacterium]
MTKKILLAVVIIMLGVAILSGCSSQPNGSANNTSNTGTPAGDTSRAVAPDFSWKDTSGNVVKLSELKGKVILIDFWATWCGPCKMTIPHVEALYERYKDNKNVVVLGISVDDPSTAQSVPAFIKQNGMQYLVVSDSNGSVSSLYGVSSIPRFFIIDKNGRIA